MSANDDREQFQAAMHLMRDAFLVVKQQAEDTGGGFGSLAEQNGSFFDGYRQAKVIFGDTLLRLEVLG